MKLRTAFITLIVAVASFAAGIYVAGNAYLVEGARSEAFYQSIALSSLKRSPESAEKFLQLTRDSNVHLYMTHRNGVMVALDPRLSALNENPGMMQVIAQSIVEHPYPYNDAVASEAELKGALAKFVKRHLAALPNNSLKADGTDMPPP